MKLSFLFLFFCSSFSIFMLMFIMFVMFITIIMITATACSTTTMQLSDFCLLYLIVYVGTFN